MFMFLSTVFKMNLIDLVQKFIYDSKKQINKTLYVLDFGAGDFRPPKGKKNLNSIQYSNIQFLCNQIKSIFF